MNARHTAHQSVRASASAGSAAAQRWLQVLVELTPPPPSQLDKLDRGERYALLAERTRRQRAELEMWLDAEEYDDQVLTIREIEALGLLLIQCSPAVAAHLEEAPGVASVSIIGRSLSTNELSQHQLAHA